LEDVLMIGLLKGSGLSRRFLASLVLVGVLLLVLPADVLAQSGRESVTITVSRNGANACVYEIDGEGQDQDRFLVRPNAAITFRATGTNARVEVDRETRNGPRKGTRGLAVGQSASFDLTDGGDPVVRNARRSFGQAGNQNTLHKVWILCLDGEGNEEVSTDQASASGTALWGPRFQERSSAFMPSGPSEGSTDIVSTPAASSEARRRGTGGPEMEVEDP
jgi:hypothetical protein